jgi:hypothetical protein
VGGGNEVPAISTGVPIGLLVGLLAMSADAADVLTLHATSGQFLLAGFYPSYIVFLKGLDPNATKTEWVDKPYKAVLDIKEGPEKGQSVALELVVRRKPARHRMAEDAAARPRRHRETAERQRPPPA